MFDSISTEMSDEYGESMLNTQREESLGHATRRKAKLCSEVNAQI